MGMKVLIEVEVDYSDLSMCKHVETLRQVFKQNKVFGVKRVTLLDQQNLSSSYDVRSFLYEREQIYPQLCMYCKGTGVINADQRGLDCDYCNGTGKLDK